MVKTKKCSFVFVFIACVFMLFFSCNKVNAEFYDQSKNKVVADSLYVSRTNNVIKFNIEYQNGVQNVKVYICADTNNCGEAESLTKYVDPNTEVARVNQGDGVITYEYNVNDDTPASGKKLSEYTDKYDSLGNRANNYVIKVAATFCIARGASETDPSKLECKSWDDSPTYTWYSEIDLDNEGITGDSKINATLARILNIVNTIVIPILWAILAALLIVRGIMLGMDIVKSADEPEVRKKKVQGLVWLFIGVGAGYVVTIIANVVIGMFGFGGLF